MNRNILGTQEKLKVNIKFETKFLIEDMLVKNIFVPSIHGFKGGG